MKIIYPRSLRAFFTAASLCLLLATPPAQGATIIEVSGPNDDSTGGGYLGYYPLMAFSTAVDYTNVSIEISLVSYFGSGDWNLNAYLTNQVGPGTTALANEIASVSTLISLPGGPTSPPFTITPYTVFSGLNLAAGDYYLIVGGTYETANAWWAGTFFAPPTVTENDGALVTNYGAYIAVVPDAYAPASTFSAYSEEGGHWFKVTGDRTTVPGVPEPSTLSLFGIGALALAAAARRRSRRP